MKPFRTPRSLENMEGCKGRYALGEEGEDQEAGPSPFTAPMGARRGKGQPSRGDYARVACPPLFASLYLPETACAFPPKSGGSAVLHGANPRARYAHARARMG